MSGVLFDAHGIKLTVDDVGCILWVSAPMRRVEFPVMRQLGEAILAGLPKEQADG